MVIMVKYYQHVHSTFLLYLELCDYAGQSQTENSSKSVTAKQWEHTEVLPVVAYKYIYYLIPNNFISIRNLQNIFLITSRKRLHLSQWEKKDCIMNAKVIFSCNAI